MRLTSEECTGIIKAFDCYVDGYQAELRLFGSRVKDHLKGGDIDLLLLVSSQDVASELRSNKHKLLAKLYENIGEQKIDIKIAARDDLKEDPFLKLIEPDSIVLHQWCVR